MKYGRRVHLPGYFLARGLCQKGGAREASRRCGSIDQIDQCLVERDVDSHCPPGVGKEGNGEQDGACFHGCGNLVDKQERVYRARRRHMPSSTFNSLHVLTQCFGGIGGSLFHSLSGREAALDIGKPDSEGAVSLFLDHGDVVHRLHLSFWRGRPSGAPASQFVNSTHQTGRQVPPWMRQGDYLRPHRMLEGMMIAAHAIEYPAVFFQHSHQLAAIAFHVRGLTKYRSDSRGANFWAISVYYNKYSCSGQRALDASPDPNFSSDTSVQRWRGP